MELFTAICAFAAAVLAAAALLTMIRARREAAAARSAESERAELLRRQMELLSAAGDRQREQTAALSAGNDRLREQMYALSSATEAMSRAVKDASAADEARADRLRGAMESRDAALRTSIDTHMERMRALLEQRLESLQTSNQQKLDSIRATVDEKLTETLNRRIGESFSAVNERLEAVYKGLGEMRTLASGVGDLKNVLTNVKTRGTWGEVQLDMLLAQFMAPKQYERSVCVKPGSRERVDFAVILPGSSESGERMLLPIDSKFPVEDYQRIASAAAAGDAAALDEACAALEKSVRTQAKSIHDKYIQPPFTTDFAVMFLPTEGLYSEVLRRGALCEQLQQDYRVIVAGPTTISALLNSLQVGFRTLAIEKRSSDVWALLGAVKTEFGKFGDMLAKTQKNLRLAADSIDSAERRTRTIERKLRGVETLSEADSARLLPPELDADAGPADE